MFAKKSIGIVTINLHPENEAEKNYLSSARFLSPDQKPNHSEVAQKTGNSNKRQSQHKAI